MSNLSDLIGAIGKIGQDDFSVIDLIGATIGILADIGGAPGGYNDLLTLLQGGSLFGATDPVPAASDNILNTIVAQFQLLNLSTAGEDLKNQLASVNNLAVNQAFSIAQNLASDLTASPPLSSGDKSNRLEACLTAVNSLSPLAVTGGLNQVWQVVHSYQIYFVPTYPWLYEDGGLPNAAFPFTYEGLTFRETFDPGADVTGLVFNYTYILPAYLRTIEIYLAVGVGFYPNFGHDAPDHAAQIRTIVDNLLYVHDIIKGGIVSVAAPSEDDVIPYVLHDLLISIVPEVPASAGYLGQSTWQVATKRTGSLYVGPPTDYPQPYGAVNLYSGYSSVGGYPSLGGQLGVGLPLGYSGTFPPPHTGSSAWPWAEWYLGFYGKYLLYTLACNKDVYRGIGLSVVRQTINRLKSLVGDPPLAGPSFGDWSLREVFSVLGYPANDQIGARTVRNLVGFLTYAAPVSALTTPLSLRRMLEGPTPS